jgi:hypothetical protein
VGYFVRLLLENPPTALPDARFNVVKGGGCIGSGFAFLYALRHAGPKLCLKSPVNKQASSTVIIAQFVWSLINLAARTVGSAGSPMDQPEPGHAPHQRQRRDRVAQTATLAAQTQL